MMREMMYTGAVDYGGRDMRTTVTLDEDLLLSASKVVGVSERSVVLREALKSLIERDAARRLSLLGGSDPTAAAPRRRRTALAAPRRRNAP
jgi:Arc/MetJ family transcription regulator